MNGNTKPGFRDTEVCFVFAEPQTKNLVQAETCNLGGMAPNYAVSADVFVKL